MARRVCFLILLCAVNAQARGVVLVPQRVEAEPEARAYPVSKWGAAPARPVFKSGEAETLTATMAQVEQTRPTESDPNQAFLGDQREALRSPASEETNGQAPITKADPLRPSPVVGTETAFSNPAAGARLIPDSKKGIQEVSVIAGDLGYFPRTVFVNQNIPVRMYLIGASRQTLCLMMDTFNVRKQVRSEHIEEVSFTPNAPGQYRFHCPVNGMEGTLVVKEI